MDIHGHMLSAKIRFINDVINVIEILKSATFVFNHEFVKGVDKDFVTTNVSFINV